jgi:hypothetical protein
MLVFRDQTFSRFGDRRGWFDRGGRQYGNLEFHGCHFEYCDLWVSLELSKRTWVNNVVLTECSWNRCTLGTAVLEDVTVDSLRSDYQWSNGEGAPLLNRVVLCGAINEISIGHRLGAFDARWSPVRQLEFDRIRNDFYGRVDWALDISQAAFNEVRITGIPTRLIRRDPTSQVIMSRRRTSIERWMALIDDLQFVPQCNLYTMLGDFARSDADEELLVAGKLAKDFDMQLNAIDELRRVGLVEPD